MTKKNVHERYHIMWVGASIDDVRGAIRRGKLRLSAGIDGIEMRGAGTTHLSLLLARRLARRWWNAGPGGKITVGWIHSDAMIVHESDLRKPPKYKFKIISALRPKTNPGEAFHSNAPDDKQLLRIFFSEIGDKIYKLDRRFHSIYYQSSNSPVFPYPAFIADNGTKHAFSGLFVWPAGVIHDNRTSNALNKIHTTFDKYAIRRERMGYEEYARAAAHQTIARVRNKARQSRKSYNAVMQELKAVPRGTLHPTFPGGSNYTASIARLEAMQRTQQQKKKKRKRA